MSGPLDKEFNIEDWFSEVRLTVDGSTKICGNLIEDLKTLLLIREVSIETLRLGLGDTLRLCAGIAALKVKYIAQPPLDDSNNGLVKGSEKKELSSESKEDSNLDIPRYTQRQVEKLLAGPAVVNAGSGVNDLNIGAKPALPSVFESSSDPTVVCIREFMRDLLHVDGNPSNSKGEKALLPINFLSCVWDAEDVIHSAKGMSLVMQTTLKRVTAEKLTSGQWISANARILNKLISEKRLDSSQIEDYLDYTSRIGDLLQLFTTASVFRTGS